MRPDSTPNCGTKQPCLTLSTVAGNTTAYFTSHSVFHFLPGSHTVNETTRVTVEGVDSVSFVGNSLGAGHATVACNGKLSFSFKNIGHVNISNLKFFTCGLVSHVLTSSMCSRIGVKTPPHVALLFLDCSSVMLENVRVMNSYGYGLLEWNIGRTNVTNCQFYCSNRISHKEKRYERVNALHHSCPSASEHDQPGGNALIAFEYPTPVLGIQNFVNIFHSEFTYGITWKFDAYPFISGGGLGMYLGEIWGSSVHVQIYNCSLHDNASPFGANMFLHSTESHFNLNISNCKFYNGNSTFSGGGLALYVIQLGNNHTIYITNSSFTSNYAYNGSGVYLSTNDNYYVTNHPYTNLVIEQCTFDSNVGEFGSSLYVHTSLDLNTPDGFQTHTRVVVSDTTFVNNAGVQSLTKEYDCAVVHVTKVMNVTLVNTTFIENNCTCISINRSILHFKRIVSFYRNMGYNGGALVILKNTLCSLATSSSLTLSPHTVVNMVNNTAVQYGGGILAVSECNTKVPCFFQIGEFDGNFIELDVSIVMEGNRAGIAGDSIFGGCLESCYLNAGLSQKMPLTPEIFQSLFRIQGVQTQSELASRPHKICFCDHHFEIRYNCSSVSEIAHFPGEIFNVLAMAVGQYAYASPALVRTVIAPGSSGELGGQQDIQELGNTCGNLTYSVRTSQESILLYLLVTAVSNPQPATLYVSFLPCPLGFNLSGEPPECACAPQLRKPGVRCDINKQLIHRPASLWIGNYSNKVVVHTNCPFDYCRPEDNEISLYKQDEQCAFNRSGVLCGACQSGLSLVLGSSRCKPCSNIYILLLIIFALVGFVLIIILLKCNLTVSTGTLNGLIFYANIVRINHAIFFPAQTANAFTHFLSIFIAWLNLDLGIEVCFFKSLDAYIRTWMQFVFPVYIWILVGLMICTSRYSTRISKLSGSNTVSVLATLFLLSYAKLLRTIVDAISFTTLTDQHGDISFVWLLDGNRPAMKGGHIALVVISVITMVAFVLPFTTLVLLAPCLQARSGHHLLRWVNKIKPLLDAYQGPYKDRFRYWTGLTLVLRIVLVAIFGGNALGNPRINLFAISIVVLLLIKNGSTVYKKIWLNLLEFYFLLNLGIISIATLFLKSLSTEGVSIVENQTILTSIMVGSAFTVFIGILMYHSFQEFTKWRLFQECWAKCKLDHRRGTAGIDYNPIIEDIDEENPCAAPKLPTVSVIAISELREPLLTNS